MWVYTWLIHALQYTIAAHHCSTPLPHTIAAHHCSTPLQYTIAVHHCSIPLPHTIAAQQSKHGIRPSKPLSRMSRVCVSCMCLQWPSFPRTCCVRMSNRPRKSFRNTSISSTLYLYHVYRVYLGCI